MSKTYKDWLSNVIQVICGFLIVAILICFVYVLFDITSFISNVQSTVKASCSSIAEFFSDNSTVTQITIDELKAATDYISKSEEYFSTVSTNSIISIIYAFATTVILTAGALVLGRIAKKSESVDKKLNEFDDKSNSLTNNVNDVATNIKVLSNNYFELLNLQNIISYMLYANVLIKECKVNLDVGKDNFSLLNDVSNKLKMIPDSYINLTVKEIKSKYSNNSNFGNTLLFGFLELENQYRGLIKHYIDYYSDTGNEEYKKLYKDSKYNSIKDIIDDIEEKLNDGFYG